MAVFAIQKNNTVEVGGINFGREVDASVFRAPEKSFLSSQFGRGFDESQAQQAMTQFPMPQNNNTFKM